MPERNKNHSQYQGSREKIGGCVGCYLPGHISRSGFKYKVRKSTCQLDAFNSFDRAFLPGSVSTLSFETCIVMLVAQVLIDDTDYLIKFFPRRLPRRDILFPSAYFQTRQNECIKACLLPWRVPALSAHS